MNTEHNEYMKLAFDEAQAAFVKGEYPVGAVLVMEGQILARRGNDCIQLQDPTAHAEILVIRESYPKLNGRSFKDARLYTTLYPCPMCEKTMVEVGLGQVIYGASSFKWIREYKYVNLLPSIEGPIMQQECREIFIKQLQKRGRTDILSYEGII